MKTTYHKVLSRRTLLRGAGGIAIGLPFLEEMRATSLYAEEPEPVVRAFNCFFGLGYQRELQDRGLASNGLLIPAEPLVDKFGDRMLWLRGVDMKPYDGYGNAHWDGSGAAFTGVDVDRINASRNVTGGASLDQALRMHAHPRGMPAGMAHALNTGTWWRYSDSTQGYLHSRLPDGSPAGTADPPQDPRELFDHLFAGAPPSTSDPAQDANAAAVARAMNASILDALRDQYQYYSTPAGGLGAASRSRIKIYFEQVRAMELEVAGASPDARVDCSSVGAPEGAWYSHRQSLDGIGIDVTPDHVAREVQTMARLYALAVSCDRVRFGSFIFQSGGERFRMHGHYSYNGRQIVDWDEDETHHELWHGNKFDRCAEHLHFMMLQLAYFFEQLDAIVENGKSVFDTAMLCMSTESGNGQHGDDELHNVLHVLGPGNGRFKVGQREFVDVVAEGLDVYNTILAAYGVPPHARLDSGKGKELTQILT